MKKRYILLFLCLISAATGIGLITTKTISTDKIRAFEDVVGPVYTYLAQTLRSVFPIKVYPGELMISVPESTGSLPPKYFKRYTYTYTAQYDGSSYTQENSDFVQQKKITNNLLGGHNTIELSVAKNAPAHVFISIFMNSFDVNNKLIHSQWIASFKTTE